MSILFKSLAAWQPGLSSRIPNIEKHRALAYSVLNKQWVTCQTRNGLEVFVKHVNILDRHMEMMDADNRVLGDS